MVESTGNITKEDEDKNGNFGPGSADSGSETPLKSNRRLILIVLSVIVIHFATMLPFGVMSPFFATVAAKKGITGLQTGLIFGVFQLTFFVISPVFGMYINKLGPKRMMVLGPLICGLANIGFAFVYLDNDKRSFLALCLIIRIISGVGSALVLTADYAVVASLLPNHLGIGMGALTTAQGVGIAIGPSIGGGLFAVGGFKLPFLVVGGIVIAGSCLMLIIIPNIKEVDRVSGNFVPLLKSPGCLILYMVIASTMWAIISIEPILSPFLSKNFDLTVGVIGLFYVLAPITYALLSPLFGMFIDKKGGHWQIMIIGNCILGVAFLFLGPCPLFEPHVQKSVAGVAVSLTVSGIALPAVLIPAFPALHTLARVQGCDDNFQTFGLVSGFYNSALSLGGFIGAVLGGYLNGKYGFGWATSTDGFVSLFMVPLLVTYVVVKVIRRDWPLKPTDTPTNGETDDEKKPIMALETINE